jgi:hypothetical protein
MPRYLLAHRHEAHECGSVFAAWKGFDSPLRHRATIGSCFNGGHRVWWLVEVADELQAMTELPRFVAERTEAIEVTEVVVP